jgi:hypothetical protein
MNPGAGSRRRDRVKQRSRPIVSPRTAPIALDSIQKFLTYDAQTGGFVRKVARPHGPVGSSPGYRCADGSIRITVAGIPCAAHDLAWFSSYGKWPERVLVHLNGDKSDNRLLNLRLRERLT